jgi:hypothetical protein
MFFKTLEANRTQRARNTLGSFVRRDAAQQQRQLDILGQRFLWKQLRLLRHETDFSVDRRHLATAVTHRTAGRDEKACRHLQQRALAAAARTDDRDEFASVNLEADSVEHTDGGALSRRRKVLPDPVEGEYAVAHAGRSSSEHVYT